MQSHHKVRTGLLVPHHIINVAVNGGHYRTLKALEPLFYELLSHTVHTEESGLLAQIPWEWQANQGFSSRQLSIISAASHGSKLELSDSSNESQGLVERAYIDPTFQDTFSRKDPLL